MRLSKFTGLLLISIICLSIFLAKVSNLIRIYDDFEIYDSPHPDPSDPALVIGDAAEPLFWFVQISDIHISIFHDPERIREFKEFCNVTVDIIQPVVVVASGDLADAKQMDNMGSRQFIEEWVFYSDILRDTRVTNKTLWLDIRGNHDSFNVPSLHRHTSFYHQFSIQGKHHKRSYMYTVMDGKEKYSFIGVDATLDPGPRRPLNFIGRITEEEYQDLKKFEEESRDSHTIWFGHYPTSCILSPNPGFRKLMTNAVAYLCGHLHTLGGVVPNMYTRQHNGFLELELGDWKENRLYRIAAFDHGLFSFVDVPYGSWPVIVITNPKNALFNTPRKENSHFSSNSTHIRLLVFSPSPMETVRVKVDNDDWIECHNVEGPLFVAAWNYLKYSNGVHEIFAYVRNRDGQAAEANQQFALDNSRLHFNLLPRITLMTDATTVFYSAFMVLVFIAVSPLLAVRVFQVLVRRKWVAGPELRLAKSSSGLFRKIWILCTINKLFYPLILYPIYLTFGPWFVGEVIDGHLGAAFAWGTYVDGKILPGAFSYFYGVIQLFWFHIPFILVLAHMVDLRFRMVCLEARSCSYSSQVWNNLPCAVLLFFQAIFAYFFYLAYGTMALFLGPLRSWSVIMGAYLWYTSATLSRQDFTEAKRAWGERECYNSVNNGVSQHAM